jgi:GT2 family glycosyltransferase
VTGTTTPGGHGTAVSSGKPVTDEVTFAIVNYDGEQYLRQTLDALLALDTGCRIVVVDDGSTDGSHALVREYAPHVELIALGANIGRIGRVRKHAVDECRTPYLFLMDNDVTFAPDCLPRLLEHLRAHPRALSCRPRLVYADRPGIIYQDANKLHYLALAADQRRDRPVEEGRSPVPRATLGGGIMLLNCAVARQIGNFDERSLFGWSDLELDVRARLLGFEVLHDPLAIGYHVERPGGLQRVVGQLYNRRRLIAICYSGRSLTVLAPALLAFEVLVLAMCLVSGYRKEYWRALRLLWADAADIRARRGALQVARVHRSDDVVLSAGSISITGRMSSSGLAMHVAPILSAVFGAYWRIARPLIRDRRPRPVRAAGIGAETTRDG